MKSKTGLSFENYKEKKYFISPDLMAYRYTAKGEIEELGSVNDVTLEQIDNYIKEQFFNMAEKTAVEWQELFTAAYQNHYDKENFLEAEIKVVNQILRGEKNTIIDSWGVTHEIISYLNGMPVIFHDDQYLSKLSPSITISRGDIMGIRKYMVYEYTGQKLTYGYIQKSQYSRLSGSWILAEALMKYQVFLKGYFPEPKSDLREYKSLYRARAFYIYLMFLDGKIKKGEIESRNNIINIINREFPPEKKSSGKQTYDELSSKDYIYLNFATLKETYKADYDYGQKLYRMKYPEP